MIYKKITAIFLATLLIPVLPFSTHATHPEFNCADALTAKTPADAPINAEVLGPKDVTEIRHALSHVVADPPSQTIPNEPTRISKWPSIKSVFQKFAAIKNGLSRILSIYNEFRQIKKDTPPKKHAEFW